MVLDFFNDQDKDIERCCKTFDYVNEKLLNHEDYDGSVFSNVAADNISLIHHKMMMLKALDDVEKKIINELNSNMLYLRDIIYENDIKSKNFDITIPASIIKKTLKNCMTIFDIPYQRAKMEKSLIRINEHTSKCLPIDEEFVKEMLEEMIQDEKEHNGSIENWFDSRLSYPLAHEISKFYENPDINDNDIELSEEDTKKIESKLRSINIEMEDMQTELRSLTNENFIGLIEKVDRDNRENQKHIKEFIGMKFSDAKNPIDLIIWIYELINEYKIEISNLFFLIPLTMTIANYAVIFYKGFSKLSESRNVIASYAKSTFMGFKNMTSSLFSNASNLLFGALAICLISIVSSFSTLYITGFDVKGFSSLLESAFTATITLKFFDSLSDIYEGRVFLGRYLYDSILSIFYPFHKRLHMFDSGIITKYFKFKEVITVNDVKSLYKLKTNHWISMFIVNECFFLDAYITDMVINTMNDYIGFPNLTTSQMLILLTCMAGFFRYMRSVNNTDRTLNDEESNKYRNNINRQLDPIKKAFFEKSDIEKRIDKLEYERKQKRREYESDPDREFIYKIKLRLFKSWSFISKCFLPVPVYKELFGEVLIFGKLASQTSQDSKELTNSTKKIMFNLMNIVIQSAYNVFFFGSIKYATHNLDMQNIKSFGDLISNLWTNYNNIPAFYAYYNGLYLNAEQNDRIAFFGGYENNLDLWGVSNFLIIVTIILGIFTINRVVENVFYKTYKLFNDSSKTNAVIPITNQEDKKIQNETLKGIEMDTFKEMLDQYYKAVDYDLGDIKKKNSIQEFLTNIYRKQITDLPMISDKRPEKYLEIWNLINKKSHGEQIIITINFEYEKGKIVFKYKDIEVYDLSYNRMILLCCYYLNHKIQSSEKIDLDVNIYLHFKSFLLNCQRFYDYKNYFGENFFKSIFEIVFLNSNDGSFKKFKEIIYNTYNEITKKDQFDFYELMKSTYDKSENMNFYIFDETYKQNEKYKIFYLLAYHIEDESDGSNLLRLMIDKINFIVTKKL